MSFECSSLCLQSCAEDEEEEEEEGKEKTFEVCSHSGRDPLNYGCLLPTTFIFTFT